MLGRLLGRKNSTGSIAVETAVSTPAVTPGTIPSRPVPVETPLAQLLERTVEQIATIFGRLSYLSNLRDPTSGLYRDQMFRTVLAPNEVDRVLRSMHLKCFCRWLSLNMVQQRGDLTRYLGHETHEDDIVLRQLRDNGAFLSLVPADAAQQEKLLFESDLLLVVHTMLGDFPVTRAAAVAPTGPSLRTARTAA
jgi:hypothetical protein